MMEEKMELVGGQKLLKIHFTRLYWGIGADSAAWSVESRVRRREKDEISCADSDEEWDEIYTIFLSWLYLECFSLVKVKRLSLSHDGFICVDVFYVIFSLKKHEWYVNLKSHTAGSDQSAVIASVHHRVVRIRRRSEATMAAESTAASSRAEGISFLSN